MSTSASDHRRMRILARRYLLISIFCLLFSCVYEFFSHGVRSGFMISLFLFPLLLGAVPSFLVSIAFVPVPSAAARCTWHAGVAALAVGSCLSGILEIYGTTSPYVRIYWTVGAALLLAGALRYFLSGGRHRSGG